MEQQQWQSLGDLPGNRQSRYGHSTSQHTREYSSAGQHQGPTGFSYETYQTSTVPSHPQSSATTPTSTPLVKQEYSGDGDVAMEDADPYNRMKYPTRPNHSHRSSAQYLSQEDSATSRRYSPMKALSPSSPYASSPQQPAQTYGAYVPQNASARQSPTRPNLYSTPSSQAYYSSTCKLPLYFVLWNGAGLSTHQMVS